MCIVHLMLSTGINVIIFCLLKMGGLAEEKEMQKIQCKSRTNGTKGILNN